MNNLCWSKYVDDLPAFKSPTRNLCASASAIVVEFDPEQDFERDRKRGYSEASIASAQGEWTCLK